MSEIQLSTFENPISVAANVGHAPANTPVFYFHNARPADLHNIRYLKQSLGLLNEEKKINDIIGWMTSNRKDTTFMDNKYAETKRVNELLCKFILKYLNELCWKTLHANMNEAPAEASLLGSELSTIDVHDALKQIIPAFKGVGEIMNTMLEYKFPSKLVGASLSTAIKQANLEVEEKTGEILNKKVNKKKNKK